MQVFGGAGICDNYCIDEAFTSLRTLWIADGPDEVHKRTLARLEVKKVASRLQHFLLYQFLILFCSFCNG